MHRDPVKGRERAKWRILMIDCLWAYGKVRLERIVLVPFCTRRVYDLFSALRYKLGKIAIPLLLFIWRQSASQEYGVGGQMRRELSLHILFIFIHLNGTCWVLLCPQGLDIWGRSLSMEGEGWVKPWITMTRGIHGLTPWRNTRKAWCLLHRVLCSQYSVLNLKVLVFVCQAQLLSGRIR